MGTKIRASALGEACTLRFPGCDLNQTVVFAHIRTKGTGIGRKPHDSMGVYACHNCHDVLDGRKGAGMMEKEVSAETLRALAETHGILIDKGLMLLK